ncbi:hypothetical protein [Rhodococcus gordoniae]|uniref:hypothetical protein n=1 Tax=Rhodococcus gordoniae TaxID=223392 RepID=UPI0020CB8050|nr:hypothetical protein [Rhodococcus gordoniae]UTT46907.1 hypothetical protein NMQ04_11325 [Rhodococcus gordoniae]
MWMLSGKLLRRRILFVLAVPLGAGLLSALAQLLQRRRGRPTSVSESLFAIASALRRRTFPARSVSDHPDRSVSDHPPAPETRGQP